MDKATNECIPENYLAANFPRRVEIELSAVCNLRCSYCPRRFLENLDGFIDFSLFKRLIDEISSYPETILVLHRRGESLLHPSFVSICNYVKGKFKEIQLATNATLLDEERSKAIIDAITFISFSIDVPEVFNKTRAPANYKDIEKKIINFIKINNGRVITQVSMVNTIGTPQKNIDFFKERWSKKVDRVRIYEEHSRDGRFGSLVRGRGARQACVMPFYEMLICFDGKVRRCNHDWDGAALGDVGISSIKDIWHSSAYSELRKQHKALMIFDAVCKSCDSWYSEIGSQGTGEVIEFEK